jgi:acyl carrier protein
MKTTSRRCLLDIVRTQLGVADLSTLDTSKELSLFGYDSLESTDIKNALVQDHGISMSLKQIRTVSEQKYMISSMHIKFGTLKLGYQRSVGLQK